MCLLSIADVAWICHWTHSQKTKTITLLHLSFVFCSTFLSSIFFFICEIYLIAKSQPKVGKTFYLCSFECMFVFIWLIFLGLSCIRGDLPSGKCEKTWAGWTTNRQWQWPKSLPGSQQPSIPASSSSSSTHYHHHHQCLPWHWNWQWLRKAYP